MRQWWRDEPLNPKLSQASTKIEVVYHTDAGRYVEVIKDRDSLQTAFKGDLQSGSA